MKAINKLYISGIGLKRTQQNQELIQSSVIKKTSYQDAPRIKLWIIEWYTKPFLVRFAVNPEESIMSSTRSRPALSIKNETVWQDQSQW